MQEPTGGIKIRVLIVDDSAIIRKMYSAMLSSDPGIEVVGTAPDPYVARELLVKFQPDVMTLDIEMPRMDGISFLEKVMAHMPTRTLVISSLSVKGSAMALSAFAAGAIDVMEKPSMDVEKNLNKMAADFIARVKTVAHSKIQPVTTHFSPKAKGPLVNQSKALSQTTHQILAIASSTGGTEALKVVLADLPADSPGIVIVQHMPPVFTKTYAESLNRICALNVKEAEEGDKVLPGTALVAPGNFHMEVKRSGGYYHVHLHQEPMLHGVRPAADFLMKSVAQYAGPNAMGLILTGMGRDGAQGLLAMRTAGSFNIAQSEETCVVFGMPKEAIQVGAINKTLDLNKIGPELVRQFKERDVITKGKLA